MPSQVHQGPLYISPKKGYYRIRESTGKRKRAMNPIHRYSLNVETKKESCRVTGDVIQRNNARKKGPCDQSAAQQLFSFAGYEQLRT